MGGNVFKDKTKSIKLEHIEPTVQKYFKELQKVFPSKSIIFNKKHFQYIGSVGKKPESGDIDFAIDTLSLIDFSFSEKGCNEWNTTRQEVVDQYKKYKKRYNRGTAKRKHASNNRSSKKSPQQTKRGHKKSNKSTPTQIHSVYIVAHGCHLKARFNLPHDTVLHFNQKLNLKYCGDATTIEYDISK
jgi:hypothetical protein